MTALEFTYTGFPLCAIMLARTIKWMVVVSVTRLAQISMQMSEWSLRTMSKDIAVR
jgi:hypothetical protein